MIKMKRVVLMNTSCNLIMEHFFHIFLFVSCDRQLESRNIEKLHDYDEKEKYKMLKS
jgi:hypothetical protein